MSMTLLAVAQLPPGGENGWLVPCGVTALVVAGIIAYRRRNVQPGASSSDKSKLVWSTIGVVLLFAFTWYALEDESFMRVARYQEGAFKGALLLVIFFSAAGLVWLMPEKFRKITAIITTVLILSIAVPLAFNSQRKDIWEKIRVWWRSGREARAAVQVAPQKPPAEVWQIPPGDPSSAEGWVEIKTEQTKAHVEIAERGELWIWPEYRGGVTDPPFVFRKGQTFALGDGLKVLRLKAAGQTAVAARISFTDSRY